MEHNLSKIKLLKIAIQIQKMNVVTLGITGSLLFYLKGIPLRRKIMDIDLVGKVYNINEIMMPKGFKLIEGTDGSSSKSIVFQHIKTGLKVDILYTEEEIEKFSNVYIGQLEKAIKSKITYSILDKKEESRKKHREDLELMEPVFWSMGINIETMYLEFNICKLPPTIKIKMKSGFLTRFIKK
jgi:hypothetical protein